MKATPTTRLLIVAVSGLSLLAACSDSKTAATTTAKPVVTEATTPVTEAPTTTAAPSFEGNLVGTFAITAGDCASGTPTGSYFQMVQPKGTAAAGPFIPNADSKCSNTNYTLLSPGTDGGLITGAAQPAPTPAFDAKGNGLAGLVTAPTKFFGVDFAVATDSSGKVPSITATKGTLTGDLSAFTAYYGTGVFNQGAPKPDGTGSAPTGTIDPATGHFTLTWTSLISGGAFNGFTGVWHLEGTFTPKA